MVISKGRVSRNENSGSSTSSSRDLQPAQTSHFTCRPALINAVLLFMCLGTIAGTRASAATCAPSVRQISIFGNALDSVRFGTIQREAIARLKPDVGQLRAVSVNPRQHCGITSEANVGDVRTFFEQGRFVGYQVGSGVRLDTSLRVRNAPRIGEAIRTVRRRYGGAFSVSGQQGGSWTLKVPTGRIVGLLTAPPSQNSPRIKLVGAGKFGCMAP